MKPAIQLEESEPDGVSRTLVPIMKDMTLAESKCIGRCEFEQVRLRSLVVPFVERTRQRCMKQILVANAGTCTAEERDKPLVSR